VNRVTRPAKSEKFPDKLTGFKTLATVNIEPRHVKIESDDFESISVEGCEWSLELGELLKESPELKSLEAFASHGSVKGYLSPVHDVTLSGAAKKAAGIPNEAKKFVFCYPATFKAAPEADEKLDPVEAESLNADLAFLAHGGFMYFGESVTDIVRMNAVIPSEGFVRGLQFGPPLTWESQWSQRLLHANRLQPITMKDLRHTGFTHFCWIRPNEVMWFGNEAGAPICPFGGFAYIYLDDMPPVSPPAAVREKTRHGRRRRRRAR